MLAAKGYRVSLLDIDIYAPSLHAYFDHVPDKWINDLLFDNAQVGEVMADMTHVIDRHYGLPRKKGGKLWIGFSNPQKEEIYRLEGGKQASAGINLLRRFIQLREELISDYDSDYIIIDTSPGIRYWSINSLAIADTLFLTLKMDDLDIEGTRKMAKDMYGSFTKFGAKSYLLLNRVSGYCIPAASGGTCVALPLQGEPDFMLSREVAMEIISAIPCYCDIQFRRKEFLTVLEHPDHPFAEQLERLASSVREIRV